MAACRALLCCALLALSLGSAFAQRSTGGNSTTNCPDVPPFECTPTNPDVLQTTPGYAIYPCQDYWKAYDAPCEGSSRPASCAFDLSTQHVSEAQVASYLAAKCDATIGCQAFQYLAPYKLAFLKVTVEDEVFHIEDRCDTDNITTLWVKTSDAKEAPGESHTGRIVGIIFGVLIALALVGGIAFAFHNNLWCFANWRPAWYSRADFAKKGAGMGSVMPSVSLPAWVPGVRKQTTQQPMSGPNTMSHDRMHDVEM